MFPLLTTRRFAPLFFTQFFSAFNDNFLKNVLVFVILYRIGGSDGEALVTVAGAVFIAPFFLLSGLGGEMADSFDKGVVARRLKLVEILAAALSVGGFALQNVPLLFVALALFGIIAALFGPIKYGILPDHLAVEELPAANALVEGATFIAILAGTVVGALAAQGGGSQSAFAALMMGCALACYGAAWFIPRTGAAAPQLRINRNIFASTFALLREIGTDRRLVVTGIMTSLFWLIGAVVMSLLPPLVKNVMGGAEPVVSTYLAIFAVAIALGSGLGSWLSAGRIVLLPAPLAMAGMAAFLIELGFAAPGAATGLKDLSIAAFYAYPAAWRVGFDLGMLAICGGVFIVPTFSAAQSWAKEDRRARVIAGFNVLNAAFMVVGALAIGVLQASGVPLSHLFFVLGAFAALSALWIFRALTTKPLRDLIAQDMRPGEADRA